MTGFGTSRIVGSDNSFNTETKLKDVVDLESFDGGSRDTHLLGLKNICWLMRMPPSTVHGKTARDADRLAGDEAGVVAQ